MFSDAISSRVSSSLATSRTKTLYNSVSLFFIYDKFLGQQIPVEENEAIDKIMANIWRGEMLGVFGNIAQPFIHPGAVSWKD